MAIQKDEQRELDKALDKLILEVREGVQHGFFEYSITCEIIGKGKRRLTLRAGKNHQFTIPVEDLN